MNRALQPECMNTQETRVTKLWVSVCCIFSIGIVFIRLMTVFKIGKQLYVTIETPNLFEVDSTLGPMAYNIRNTHNSNQQSQAFTISENLSY